MTKIIEPTAEERAYNEGWTAYFMKTGSNINPYNPESEVSLYESFLDGWSTAQRSDKVIVEDDSDAR